MQPATLERIMAGGIKKAMCFGGAAAGIMGAKRTADLIPLCHPLALTAVSVELTCDPARNAVDITARARWRADRRRDGGLTAGCRRRPHGL